MTPISDEQLRKDMRSICVYVVEHGRAPTRRELLKPFGLASVSVVDYRLNHLVRAGYLWIERQVARGLAPTAKGWEAAGIRATSYAEEEGLDVLRAIPRPWPLDRWVRRIFRYGGSYVFEVSTS